MQCQTQFLLCQLGSYPHLLLRSPVNHMYVWVQSIKLVLFWNDEWSDFYAWVQFYYKDFTAFNDYLASTKCCQFCLSFCIDANLLFFYIFLLKLKKRIINGIRIVVDFYKSFVKLSFFKNKGNFLKKEMQKSFQKLYWYKIDHQLHKKGKRGSHPSHWKRVGFLLELACHVKSTWIDETLNYHRKSGEKSCRCHSK